ncbi:UvrD-helicase domain-containing protein [Rhodoferax sp.]|uniref:UvrD-helicase domain-containing protein n=1 Tax=Rhodoferax sp. TaxID=50421 RepID=UPI002768D20B|nr:ATP-dependent helicase [Rhodoferax sp.]
MNQPARDARSKTGVQFKAITIVPTAEQLAIQIATERVVLVEANAGATKTTTLALRMAEAWARGINPDHVLALTYTDTACVALKLALQLIGVPYTLVQRFRIQTFESFCTQVLREVEGRQVPVFEEMDALSPYVWEAIQRVADSQSERWRSELLMPTLGDNSAVEEFLRVNSRLKGTLRDVLERQEQPVSPDYAASIGVEYTQLKVFLAYERIRRRENNDMPVFRGAQDATYDLARMLIAGESVRDCGSWPALAKVIVVDEMHDLNQSMYEVLKELMDTTDSVFCGVGDMDQVIHEAAGAEARFMRTELQNHVGRSVAHYPLSHSFRFGQSLADLGKRIADKPYRSMAPHETKIEWLRYDDANNCAAMVVSAAAAWKPKARPKTAQFAILLRHSYQSVDIENGLLAQGVAYTTSGFDSYLMRPEVLLVRGLLAVAAEDLSSVAQEETRKKVMQAIFFFSGAKISVEGREAESQQSLLDEALGVLSHAPHFLVHMFENQILRNVDAGMRRRLAAAVKVAKEQTGPELLGRLLEAVQIKSMISERLSSHQRRQDAIGNLAGLQRAAARFDTAAAYFQSLNAAEQSLHMLKSRKTAGVLIGSMASVKGLEFDQVVIPYLESGEFPAPKSDFGEERNMLYVAVTRARRALTLYASREYPSVFVAKLA